MTLGLRAMESEGDLCVSFHDKDIAETLMSASHWKSHSKRDIQV